MLNLNASPRRIQYEPVEAAKLQKSTTGSKDVSAKLKMVELDLDGENFTVVQWPEGWGFTAWIIRVRGQRSGLAPEEGQTFERQIFHCMWRCW